MTRGTQLPCPPLLRTFVTRPSSSSSLEFLQHFAPAGADGNAGREIVRQFHRRFSRCR